MFMVRIGGVVGTFVPVVMVERGDATGVSLVLMSYSQFCYTVLCVSYVEVIVNTDSE
jgi:hypothetical protein